MFEHPGCQYTHTEITLSLTSANPPAISISCCCSPSEVYLMTPFESTEISGAWFLSTVKEPKTPGIVTEVTSPLNETSCAEIILSVISLHILEHFFTLSDSLVDGTDIEECLFRQMVEFAAENHLETADSLGQGHHYTGKTGKLLSHVERL